MGVYGSDTGRNGDGDDNGNGRVVTAEMVGREWVMVAVMVLIVVVNGGCGGGCGVIVKWL